MADELFSRGFFGKHFGAENVLWVKGEGKEPTDEELRWRLEARRMIERHEADLQRRAEIRAVERLIALTEAGVETGLNEYEIARLPELLGKLRGE